MRNLIRLQKGRGPVTMVKQKRVLGIKLSPCKKYEECNILQSISKLIPREVERECPERKMEDMKIERVKPPTQQKHTQQTPTQQTPTQQKPTQQTPNQEGEGNLLPGDLLKLKLLKKVGEKKRIPTSNKNQILASAFVNELYPILKKKAGLPALDTSKLQKLLLLKFQKNKSVKDKARTASDVLVKLVFRGDKKSHSKLHKLLTKDVHEAFVKLSSMKGHGKSERKQFWKDFGKGFVEGFVGTLKVGLPLLL